MKYFFRGKNIFKIIITFIAITICLLIFIYLLNHSSRVEAQIDSQPLSYAQEDIADIALPSNWEVNKSENFDPSQYYLVDYPSSYPVRELQPKFIDPAIKVLNQTKYTDNLNKVTIEISPTLGIFNEKLIKQFINTLSVSDSTYLNNRNFRITNILAERGFWIIEMPEVIHVQNETADDNLPILKYEYYYLGVSNNDKSVEFIKNNTKEFTAKLNSLNLSSQDSYLKTTF